VLRGGGDAGTDGTIALRPPPLLTSVFGESAVL